MRGGGGCELRRKGDKKRKKRKECTWGLGVQKKKVAKMTEDTNNDNRQTIVHLLSVCPSVPWVCHSVLSSALTSTLCEITPVALVVLFHEK